MKSNYKKYVIMTGLVLAAFDLTSCAKTPNSAAPVALQLQMGTYATVQHKTPLWKLLEVPKAHAAVTSLKMCFKRLRFKSADQDTASPSTDASNMDFPIGEITIGSTGASLGAVTVPAGTYRRIEFDLDSHCASGKSIQLVNANGSFSSAQTITVKFSGTFTASVDGTLSLGVQSILDALNTYNNTDMKVAVESASGILKN